MRGSKTPKVTQDKFRALYLYSGNASDAGRQCGMSVSASCELARKLSKEPGFIEARKQLRARALDEVERMLMDVAVTARKRFSGKGPRIPPGAHGVTIVDKRPDYGKLLVDTHRSIVGRVRVEQEKEQLKDPGDTDRPVINVHLHGVTDAAQEGQEPAGSQPEHQGTNEERAPAEAIGSDRASEGR